MEDRQNKIKVMKGATTPLKPQNKAFFMVFLPDFVNTIVQFIEQFKNS